MRKTKKQFNETYIKQGNKSEYTHSFKKRTDKKNTGPNRPST